MCLIESRSFVSVAPLTTAEYRCRRTECLGLKPEVGYGLLYGIMASPWASLSSLVACAYLLAA